MATFEITVTVDLDEEMVNENNDIVSRDRWALSYIDEILSSNILLFNAKIMDLMVSTDPSDTKEVKDVLIKSYKQDIMTLKMMKKTLVAKEVT